LRYRFEDYLLDTERHELRKDAAIVAVEPQVFDLLAFLIRHRARVVSRDELLASVWESRSISDSTFTSRINAARTALSDSGDGQRLVRTIPRRGYRFVGEVREEPDAAAIPAAVASATSPPVVRDGDDSAAVEVLPPMLARLSGVRSGPSSRAVVMLCAAAAVGVIAGAFLWAGWAPGKPVAQRFDPAVVPLITNQARQALTGYAQRPGAKALAIAGEGWSVADGASSRENAEQEALRQCAARTKGVCRIYASGMEVVWSKDALPMPAAGDLRSEVSETPLVVDDIPTLDSTARNKLVDAHLKRADHKALALATRGYFWVNNMPSRQEAARLAVERCAELTQRPCLLLAVDGFLTTRIPKSRRVERIFLPSVEGDMSVADRERISRIYQGAEWRALARGKAGTWHPFVAALSEAAAVEGALKSCAETSEACRLYAIGNFRVEE
jgi:DNA-binding winged helix-turn-helix (wHTH) protein